MPTLSLRVLLPLATAVAASIVTPALLASASPGVATTDQHTRLADRSAVAAAPADSQTGPTVRVRGAVGEPLRLSRSDLLALPQHSVTTSYTANGVPVSPTFTGPLLLDVLEQAQPRFDPAVKNDALSFAVLATATDGYRSVVSWGELDPGFEGKQVLLAVDQDGAPLARPRLVVPGDAKGGRYVSDVIRLKLIDLGG